MTHSAKPTVSPVANIVFCLFCLLDFKKWGRTDGQTDDMCKNNDPYRLWLWAGRVDQFCLSCLSRCTSLFWGVTFKQIILHSHFTSMFQSAAKHFNENLEVVLFLCSMYIWCASKDKYHNTQNFSYYVLSTSTNTIPSRHIKVKWNDIIFLLPPLMTWLFK